MYTAALAHLMHAVCYLVLVAVFALDPSGGEEMKLGSYALLCLMAVVAFSHSVWAIVVHRKP